MRIPAAPPALRAGMLVVVLTGLISGCTAGGEDAADDPAALIAAAKATVDGTEALHFTLTSADVPDGITALVGGEGDAARPDQFAGDLDVTIGGLAATVGVVSIDGTVYAQLPFATTFTEIDPATIGISDPGSLLDPEAGVTGLLGAATDATAGEDARIGDTVVRQVTATIPSAAVAAILGSADEAGSFDAVFGIDPETDQLLRATITGPFLAAETPNTYTVDLSDYGKTVDITAPATS